MKQSKIFDAFRMFSSGRTLEGLRIAREIAADESRAGRHSVANAISRAIEQGARQMKPLPSRGDCVQLFEANRKLDALSLTNYASAVLDGFVTEWKHRDRLAEYGVPLRTTIILSGPSGNGKTAIAECLATELGLPLGIVSMSSVIDSHLGCTGRNVAKCFEFAADNACVLLFDEADSLVSARRQSTSAGDMESNRIVNQLILSIDRMSLISPVVLATNMRESFDTAVARRFAIDLEIGGPTPAGIEKLVDRMVERFPILRSSRDSIASRAREIGSYAGIEAAILDVVRQQVLCDLD